MQTFLLPAVLTYLNMPLPLNKMPAGQKVSLYRLLRQLETPEDQFKLGLAMRLRIHAVHADDAHVMLCGSVVIVVFSLTHNDGTFSRNSSFFPLGHHRHPGLRCISVFVFFYLAVPQEWEGPNSETELRNGFTIQSLWPVRDCLWINFQIFSDIVYTWGDSGVFGQVLVHCSQSPNYMIFH